MQRILAFIALVAIFGGLALGYCIAPKYTPPNEAGQGRLRKRAETLYRALRQMDYAGATRMMTPARQYMETAKLRDEAQATQHSQSKLSQASRDSLAKAAESILADKLVIRIEGNWALTSGPSEVYENGNMVPFALDDLVWICTDGDWWNYGMTTAELAAYGNPPDFARNALLTAKQQPIIRDFSALPAESPQPMAPAGKPDAASTDAGSVQPAPNPGQAGQETSHGN